MANVFFKKSTEKTGNDIKLDTESYPLNEGTLYFTADQELYLDSSDKRQQIAGNIIYQDLENAVNPDEEGTPPTFGGHTANEFLLKTDNIIPEIYIAYMEIFTDNVGTISIPSDITDLNNLMVYENGLLLNENIHYVVDISNKTINLIDYTAKTGEIFTFTGPTYANSNAGNSSGSTSNGSNIILAKTLTYNNWSSFQQNISVPEVVANSSQQFISISPTYDSINDYAKFEIQCISQQQGLLKFSCSSIPNVNISININIQNV